MRQPLPGHPYEFSYPLDVVERLGFTPMAYSYGNFLHVFYSLLGLIVYRFT